MRRLLLFCFLSLHFIGHAAVGSDDFIVFTAYQGLLSRIYVLNMDGTVHTYHEYENYRWQDITVIDNEVYIAEAIMPGIYKVDILTGDLTLVMHDFWLYYFYGLAWDGTYFYVKEWSMNRYDINGVKHGSASFSGSVFGATFADGYYWMMGNENLVRCWSFDDWPTLVENPLNNFTPPSEHCRGLWYDGEYFWTAESIESQLGKIYRFDNTGQIIEEWTAPAFRGWGVAKVTNPQVGIADHETLSKSIIIFPNPFRDHFNLQINVNGDTDILIEMIDITSSSHFVLFEGSKQAGMQRFNWDANSTFLSSLPSGLFFIRTTMNDEVSVHKVFKAN